MKQSKPVRKPWPDDFPEVIIHAPLQARNAHRDYLPAKSGDKESAYRLVLDLFDYGEARKLLQFITYEHEVLLAGISALETTGFNAIPDTLVEILADAIDADIETGEIRQSNKVAHTKTGGWHRYVTQAQFTGRVESGRNYVLVDDHVGFGGTLANLRGHIEHRGGHVIAMTTLTESPESRRIALQKSTLDMLISRHGQELEQFWQETFGFGLDCLTEREAVYLCRPHSLDEIRGQLATAAEKARSLDLSPIKIPGSAEAEAE